MRNIVTFWCYAASIAYFTSELVTDAIFELYSLMRHYEAWLHFNL